MRSVSPIVDIDPLVEQVRAMRREASVRAKRSRIELYAKISERVRVERRDDTHIPLTQRVFESGIAVRALTAARGRAGFAAASGMSPEVAAWVFGQALSSQSCSPSAGLDAEETPPVSRWDLDSGDELPDTEALVIAVSQAPAVRWVEAGTTIEVLVGPDDWFTVRRRQRLWAQVSNESNRLVAQRGFEGWHALIDAVTDDEVAMVPARAGASAVLFMPEAASSVVTALVDSFHRGGETSCAVTGGKGWTVHDDPTHPAGLSGGSFDDAGFPASPRPLGENGQIAGRLEGPGTYHRRSFREPPTPGASNLVVPPGSPAGATAVVPVRTCRVVRLGPEVWVLDLEFAPDAGGSKAIRRSSVRVSPRFLLEHCSGRIGAQRVTAAGPIVPGLLFEGLPPRECPG